MENVTLVLSMQDVSRILQCVVQQPYAQVSDLVDKIKAGVEASAAAHRSIGQGLQVGTATTSPKLPNGEEQH